MWFHIHEYIEFHAKVSKSYIQLKTSMATLILAAEGYHVYRTLSTMAMLFLAAGGHRVKKIFNIIATLTIAAGVHCI